MTHIRGESPIQLVPTCAIAIVTLRGSATLLALLGAPVCSMGCAIEATASALAVLLLFAAFGVLPRESLRSDGQPRFHAPNVADGSRGSAFAQEAMYFGLTVEKKFMSTDHLLFRATVSASFVLWAKPAPASQVLADGAGVPICTGCGLGHRVSLPKRVQVAVVPAKWCVALERRALHG